MKWTQKWHHSDTSCLGKYAAKVVYGGYGLTYRATYIIYCMVNVQQANFLCAKAKNIRNDTIFLLESISLIWDSCVMLNFPVVAQSPYYMYVTSYSKYATDEPFCITPEKF